MELLFAIANISRMTAPKTLNTDITPVVTETIELIPDKRYHLTKEKIKLQTTIP